MSALDQVLGAGGMDLTGLAARFGLSPDQAGSAMGSLMPAVVGGFQRKAETGDLGPVTDAANGIDQPDTSGGNDILGHIFGSKDVSRQVADHAADRSGVSSTVLKSMLPVVAAMVAKHVAAGGAGQSGIGGMLGSLTGGNAPGGPGGLGSLLGGGGANPLDTILAGMNRR